MTDRSTGTGREYVETFVKDQDLENYLSENQPQYDPNKSIPNVTPSPPVEKSSDESPKTSTFNFHERSKNPFSNEKPTEVPQKQNTMWVVRDFLDQRREIHETAVDNCADLHADLLTCFNHGSWWDKAKMCEQQKQRFWKCYNKQKNFFKAANYCGPENTPEQDSQIYREAVLLSQSEESDSQENNNQDSKQSTA